MVEPVVGPSLEDLIAQHAAARDLLDVALEEHRAAWRRWDESGARVAWKRAEVDAIERRILAHVSDIEPEGFRSAAVDLGPEVSS